MVSLTGDVLTGSMVLRRLLQLLPSATVAQRLARTMQEAVKAVQRGTKMMQGTIATVVEERGFGFVRPDAYGKDLFSISRLGCAKSSLPSVYLIKRNTGFFAPASLVMVGARAMMAAINSAAATQMSARKTRSIGKSKPESKSLG
jgi:hypothetical protein